MLVNYLLSFLVWLPIVGGIALLVIGDAGDAKSAQARLMRMAALAFTVLTFLASVVMYIGFDNAEPGMQFIERKLWIEAFDVWYYLGVDGLSAPFAGELTLAHCQAHLDDLVRVSDDEMVAAMRLLLERCKILAEPAGAAATAALLAGRITGLGDNVHVVAIVSGGNIDLSQVTRLFSAA